MLADGPHILLKELGHKLLRHPDGLILKADLDSRPPILGLVKEAF
jgi:hypothetical protein